MACQILHREFCGGTCFYPNNELIPKFKKITDASQFSATIGYKYHYIASIVDKIKRGEGHKMYHKIVRHKKNGDERIIYSPEVRLKCLQKAILEFLYTRLKFSKHVVGFVPGKSTVDHAKFHLNKKMLIKIDIKDFFPSIIASNIYLNLCEHFTDHIAMIITNICTYKRHAAQGIPTSPFLANMCFESVDKKLIDLSKQNNMAYSRYADDMVFSTNDDVDPDAFIKEAYKIIGREGYRVNDEKTKIMRDGKTKKICGIIVSDKLNIPRDVRKRLRAMIHNSLNNGIESQAKESMDFIKFMDGYLAYIRPINPELHKDLYGKWRKAKESFLHKSIKND